MKDLGLINDGEILSAKLEPILTKYSLNLFTISFLSFTRVKFELKDAIGVGQQFLLSIFLITSQVFLILQLVDSNLAA